MKLIGDTAFNIITNNLQAFSLSDKFWQSIDTAFGTTYNRTIAELLRGKWQKGDFSDLPPIQIVDSAVLSGGKGAYSQKENRIYLSIDLIGNVESISKVIIEEIGHYVDAQINQVDSPGDEGGIFAALVQDEVLSANVLAQLRNENDGGWLEVNGQNLEVEYNNPTVSLSLTSPSTVTEDGPQNLFYVFSRTGDVTNSLTVNFNVSGSATLNDDYVQRGATSFGTSTGSVTFATGSSVVILPIDPSSDVVSDGNETVALTLAAGTGYAVGSSGAVTGIILDNDVAPGTVVRGSVAKSIYDTEHEVINYGAFAALKSDGSVVTWGNSSDGGDSSSVSSRLTSGVTQIFSNAIAFAALKSDGSVVTWGDSTLGGDSSSVSSRLTSGVTQIFSTGYVFAALKSDGSVVTWGDSTFGGNSSSVSSRLTSGVTQIFSTGYAFAALKSDGSVVTWGDSTFGGNSSSVSSRLTSGVTQIFSTGYAFAALKSDGSVVTWGGFGGDSSSVSSRLTSGVTQIFSAFVAFAALKSDGSVVTWGESFYGGDSSSVSSRLTSGVTQIFSNVYAFAALKSDGSVVTWGSSSYGGDSSSVSSRLTSGVTQIFSTLNAFAALKSDGSVVTWGNSSSGGDSSSVSSRLTSGVTQIFSNYFAFAALKSDGSVVTWGDSLGDSSSVSSRLTSGVTQIFSTGYAFAALKSDGSVVTWGDSGGDSSSVSSQLTSGVVSFADPLNDDRLVPLSTTPTITIASTNANQSEGNSGTKAFTFTVTRSVDTTGTSSANWAVTGSGTNQADGTDFSGTSGTVSFAAGETTQTITVNVSGDSTVEPDEGFTVTLSNPTNATINTATAVGTIQNDDVVAPGLATVSLSLTSPSTVTEDGPQNLFYVFSRTGDVTNSLTVNFNVSGSATLNDDYVQRGATSFGTSTGSVTFATGSSVVILPIDPSSDVVSDGNETVALTLAAGTGYAVGSSGAVTGIILDNDVAPGTVVRGSVAKSIYDSTRHELVNLYAFAALKSDGSVVTWGDSRYGGDSSSVSSSLTSGVTQIFSTGSAFAALKSDGSVVTWGDSRYGGDSSSVSSSLTSGVTQIFSTGSAFAALKSDGSVVTWGPSSEGGNSSSVSSRLTSGVTQIFSTGGAFAALKSDGSVVTWGNFGGNSSSVSSSLTSGVTQIFSTGLAFAALKSDGSVVTWGSSSSGGDSSSVSSSLTSGVTQIFSNAFAFAALKSDGSVVTWGDFGGNSSSVSSRLTSGVTQIFSTYRAFAALKSDGSVVTWGDSSYGSYGGDSSSVSSRLTSGVTQIFSTGGAFAALKSDGSVVTWGPSSEGGNSSSVSSRLTSGVTQIFSTGGAFAALKSDGSVVTWGPSSEGGNSSSVSSRLTSGVTQIFSTGGAFAALKSDGSVVTWGGWDSSSVSSQLTSGVVSFADPFNDDRLVPSTTPTITLTVNPTSVAEKGLTNLVYTFTRTGPTTNTLAVNYTIGGTATNGSDYNNIGTSVTFAAGSSTATVTVDPRPDTIGERDETVTLTVTSGSGYTVGTNGVVTAVITNADEILDDVRKNPSVFMGKIRDYDGNDLGGSSNWKHIGDADVQGDGDIESIFVNPLIERWATVGVVNNFVNFSNHGQGGDTRVVGIYIDPTLKDRPENIGGPFDSQRRFQNDLRIDNLRLLSAADYNKDGFQDMYFKVADGTAVLRALMHADGNIQYANYQSKADLTAFMTANNVSPSIWSGWI
ncbi:Calx-beta domain-containing protein [Cylindrospermopsis raciborskii]|uniref:Calx-beta domain-containing protein n=3 Tax=Cylindrospermopsis raciborskii TaxID=77022 RepID=A0A853MKC7_9CYAN|nr:Calx-beta domain-containing protein [Cylindrospermopsis raciborskii]OBU77676.1 hypothetical protein A9P98_16365 [Cylindrospermopsis raciborskii CS-505]